MNVGKCCQILHSRLPVCFVERTFATSSVQCGRKSKIFQRKVYKDLGMSLYKKPHPFDERFYISSKDVSRYREHGSEWAEKYVEERYEYAPQKPGITMKDTSHFKTIPEMVPEFIVPDLTGFELKPYVTYNVSKVVNQSEFTAQDLFDATYGSEVISKYKDNQADLEKVTAEELLEKSSFSSKL